MTSVGTASVGIASVGVPTMSVRQFYAGAATMSLRQFYAGAATMSVRQFYAGADNELSWVLTVVSASHRGRLVSSMSASNSRPNADFKLLSFLSVGTKQQSRLKYSHSLMSIPFSPGLPVIPPVHTIHVPCGTVRTVRSLLIAGPKCGLTSGRAHPELEVQLPRVPQVGGGTGRASL